MLTAYLSQFTHLKKLVVVGLISTLLVPTLALAASDDVTLTTDTVISVGGYTLNVSGSSATLESIVINVSSFDVVMQSGSSITVTAPNRNQLSATTDSDVTQTNTCTGSESSLALSATGAGTITVTPSATICSDPSSGGGGGSSRPKPKVPDGGWQIYATSTPDGKLDLSFNYGDDIRYLWISDYYNGNPSTQVNATTTVIRWPQPKFGVLYVRFCNKFHRCTDYIPKVVVSGATSTTPNAGSAYTFARNLTLNMTGADVRELQKYLNAQGFTIAATGAGSPGNETDYFGPATLTALIRFQKSHGIEPAVGYFGAITRAVVNGVAETTPAPTSETTPVTSLFTFTLDLKLNDFGEQVFQLQKYLNANGFTVAQTGAGSPGNETTYFGTRTYAALVKFQDEHAAEILTPVGLTKGSGFFGASTREFINSR